MALEAIVRFADLVDAAVKIGALAVAAFVLLRFLPARRRQGFTAKIFGGQATFNGPAQAVETLAASFEKQIDDLRGCVSPVQKPAEAPNGNGARPHHRAVNPLAWRRILWVDDHPRNILFELGKLREAGADVARVGTTTDAVAELRSDSFDIVITDMGRDEGGRTRPLAGLELILWIREHERQAGTPPVPIYVHCSSWALDAAGDRAVQHGASGATASTTELLEWILGDAAAEPPVPVAGRA